MLVEGFLIVTHSSLFVTSTVMDPVVASQMLMPSDPPILAPQMARLYTSPLVTVSRVTWKSGAEIDEYEACRTEKSIYSQSTKIRS